MTEVTFDRMGLTRRAGARIAEIARQDPDRPVPRYAGKTVKDLLVHTGVIHRRTARVVSEGLTEGPESEKPPAEGLVTWFEEGLNEMLRALDEADPDMPCWGYGPDPDVAFWRRRMALETDVHRWDAESAVGVATPFPPEVAGDGIDEVRVMWLPSVKPDDPGEPGPIAQFDPSDLEAIWTLTATDSGYELVQGAHDAQAHVIGPASDIYLAILGRLHNPLREEGNIGALARWRDVVRSMGDARL